MNVTTEYNVDQLIEEFKINGFVVFDDLIPPETLYRICEAWLPIRDRGIEIQGDNPNRGTNRYCILIPFECPFVDPDIFDHPDLVKFFDNVLGDDYVCDHFQSNTPLLGSEYQRWHRDGALIFPGLMTPTFNVILRIPLVDATEENGSIEVLPSSHYIADEEVCYKEIEGRSGKWFDPIFGEGSDRNGSYYPIRLNVKRGSVWLCDPRVIHRGTPNLSDHSRDELSMGFSRPWLFSPLLHENTEKNFPRDLWESLSDHARQVMRWQRVKD